MDVDQLPGQGAVEPPEPPARYAPAISARAHRPGQAIATEMGEPFVSLFVPDAIEQLLRSHGFADVAHFGPEEARAAYFSGRVDVEIAGAQRLVVATVAQPT